MTTVRNYDDARFWTFVLREKAIKNDQRIIEVKQALRKFYNEKLSDTVVFCDNYDGCIELYPLPESIETEAQADEYFREFEYVHFRPVWYDCSGQLFTTRFKIFKRNGRFWVYHILTRDL